MAGPRLEIHPNKTTPVTYGWRLIGDNGSDIIATDGSQGYRSEAFAHAMAVKVLSGHYENAQVISTES